MKKVYFIAGLSNGETATENKGNFTREEGALSPWLKLLSYCKDNNLTLTSLSLATADGRRWNVPSVGKNPRMKVFTDLEKPSSYKFFRAAGFNVQRETSELDEDFSVIEARYQDYAVQVWVDNNTFTSWSIISK